MTLKKMEAEALIEDLMERTKKALEEVEQLKKLPLEQLNWKEDSQTWSVLECIEHLNLYGDFYIPEIRRRIAAASKANNPIFKSGLLGNYFAKMMLPTDNMKKMKTLRDKNPNGSQLDISTLDRFRQQQQDLMTLLNQGKNVDLTKTRTSISISSLIKLRLGDTFRVVVYHNQRHMAQVHGILTRQKIL